MKDYVTPSMKKDGFATQMFIVKDGKLYNEIF